MNDLLAACEEAARAGARELVAWRGKFQAREKAPSDLVTDADLASQAAVQQAISSKFPDDLFFGEEQLDGEARPVPDRRAWVVDPLDGTTNYVHGFPAYAVSVGVVEKGRILAGVIYDPCAGECFRTTSGSGARLGDRRLAVSDTVSLSSSLVAVSLPHHVAADSPDLAHLVAAAQVCQGVRRTGSAALNLAYVAAGRVDAFWAADINPWDVAAGVLLVLEAGGVVTGIDGQPFDIWHPHFLAAGTPQLHAELLELLGPKSR